MKLTSPAILTFSAVTWVAAHALWAARGRHTTIAQHMPSAHRRYAEWTIERIRSDAAAIGSNSAKLVALILESRPHPEQGYRAAVRRRAS